MNIGGMNDYSKQMPHDIRYDVPLSAFRFFPPSMPRSSAAPVVFTLCESINA